MKNNTFHPIVIILLGAALAVAFDVFAAVGYSGWFLIGLAIVLCAGAVWMIGKA